MIIVSQDKENLMNFDNMEFIGIASDGKSIVAASIGHASKKIENSGMSVGWCIASYKTKERAKEVLQDIVISINRNVEMFEMPKE